MADYTDLPNSAVGVGGIPSGTTVTALRDNSIAIAEGAAGAPQIQTAAIADNAVTNAKVTNGTLGAEKFQTGSTEINWVGARTAGLAAGAVGSYALMTRFPASFDGVEAFEGSTHSGADLEFTNVSAAGDVTPRTGAGTWRLMGYLRNLTGNTRQTSLFLRIS